MELELKLLLDPACRGQVEDHPAFKGATRHDVQDQVTTYFDDDERTLGRHAASLRVRRGEDGFVQTVKLSSHAEAFGARPEWEWAVAGEALDLAALDRLPPAAAWIRDRGSALKPVFTTEVRRARWHIDLGGSEIEAVIDAGSIRAGQSSAPISEVELELKRGHDLGPLFALAIDLAERADLRYGAFSKAERGYALLAGEPLRPSEAADRRLPDDVTIGVAFPRLVAMALREFGSEIPLAARGDVEGVHRMRAAIRKLRTLLVLFAPCLETEAARRFNGALRDLGTVLGRGRDWDVFLTETLPGADEAVGGSASELLGPHARQCRDAAQRAIASTLEGPLPSRLILGLAAWTAEPHWLQGPHAQRALRGLAPDLLDRLARKVRKRERHLDGQDAESLHALRKSMKKLRYAAEDIGGLFKPKAVARYHKAIKHVLSTLGEINDSAVTAARLDEIAPAGRPELAGAAAAVADWAAERRKKALHKLVARMRAFSEIDPFWR